MAPDTVGVARHGALDEELPETAEGWGHELLAALRREEALSSRPVELSIVLCDDAFIRPLNATWRGLDAATDVLSFPLDDEHNLGDVIVSVETARRRVRPGEWGIEDEVLFLLIHGLLHLLGHDHEELGPRTLMEAAEQALWTAMGRMGTLRGA